MKTCTLPDPGEGLLEAEIVRWLVEPGQQVAVNDPVVEIETAKSLVELPSPHAGTVAELLVATGTVVAVGAPIFVIDDGEVGGNVDGEKSGGERSGGEKSGGEKSAQEVSAGSVLVGYGTSASTVSRRPRKSTALGRTPEADQVNESYSTDQPVSRHSDDVSEARRVEDEPGQPPLPRPGTPQVLDEASEGPGRRVFAKPVVRRLARDLGLDLATVPGSGPDGTVTTTDVAAAAASASGRHPGDGVRRIPLRGVRRTMVQSMVASVAVPQASLWLDVDVTETVALIESLKERREFAGLRISPILVLAKAVCLAIARHPEVNASIDLDREEIVVTSDVNLGIAAATARGLVVPNIKRANELNLIQLAEALNRMVGAARDGKITPADFAHGTFTITNVGIFGIEGGTPILNPGESAILCLGTIARRPWVVGSGDDERIEPRSVCTLTLTIDHRVLDGERGSRFLADVATILGDPALSMLF